MTCDARFGPHRARRADAAEGVTLTSVSVNVVIGAGSIGQAIVRRVSAGKHILPADIRLENANTAAKTLSEAGFVVTTTTVDVSSRASVHALVEAATALGEISGVIHAPGASPFQAAPETILKVDLCRTALVLEDPDSALGLLLPRCMKDELTGPRGAGYRCMVELSAAGRACAPDEAGTIGALFMGHDGAFLTGSDFLAPQ